MTAKNVKAASRVKASKTPPAATVPATENKSRTIQVPVKPDETYDRAVAGMVARGIVTNASTVIRFESHDFEGLSLMDMAGELRAQGEAVNGGDLSSLERTLTAQALSLNAIFGELARIAHCNLFKVPDVAERYLRLALKAQGQSRATVETLAAIKNPPVVFARQANINNGGHQQVNNGAAPESRPVRAGAHGHTANSAIEPNELSGGADELLTDARASQATGGAHPRLGPVGEVNRAANR